MWRLERALFFMMKQSAPPFHATFFDSSSYCGEEEESTPFWEGRADGELFFWFYF